MLHDIYILKYRYMRKSYEVKNMYNIFDKIRVIMHIFFKLLFEI